jgi:hypothetical protein
MLIQLTMLLIGLVVTATSECCYSCAPWMPEYQECYTKAAGDEFLVDEEGHVTITNVATPEIIQVEHISSEPIGPVAVNGLLALMTKLEADNRAKAKEPHQDQAPVGSMSVGAPTPEFLAFVAKFKAELIDTLKASYKPKEDPVHQALCRSTPLKALVLSYIVAFVTVMVVTEKSLGLSPYHVFLIRLIVIIMCSVVALIDACYL